MSRVLLCLVAVVALAAACTATETVVDDIATGPVGRGLQFVLPDFPEDLDVPEPVYRPGPPVAPDHLNVDETYLWCDSEGPTTQARLLIGDIWTTEEGTGFVVELEPEAYQAGESISLPTDRSLVLFFVDLHGRTGIPEEYASPEEESFGSITFDAIPCRGEGDELAFTIDGGLGAETNPGFTAALGITGTFRIAETGPPLSSPFD